jgi:hypothetical protein
MVHQYISYIYIDYKFYGYLLNLLYKILAFLVIKKRVSENMRPKYTAIIAIFAIAIIIGAVAAGSLFKLILRYPLIWQ